MTDWIELSSFRIDCLIGVLEREQRRTQPLDVEVRLGLNLEDAAGGDLARSIDYASVAAQIAFLAQHGRWRLLESMAAAICRCVLAPPGPQEKRAQVAEVEVRLRKPEVLGGVAVPGVGVRRNAGWCDLKTAMFEPRMWVDVLQETELTGAYRVHLEPTGEWRLPPGAVVYVLGGEPEHLGRSLGPGDMLPRLAGGTLGNPQDLPVSLLVVASPPLAA